MSGPFNLMVMSALWQEQCSACNKVWGEELCYIVKLKLQRCFSLLTNNPTHGPDLVLCCRSFVSHFTASILKIRYKHYVLQCHDPFIFCFVSTHSKHCHLVPKLWSARLKVEYLFSLSVSQSWAHLSERAWSGGPAPTPFVSHWSPHHSCLSWRWWAFSLFFHA